MRNASAPAHSLAAGLVAVLALGGCGSVVTDRAPTLSTPTPTAVLTVPSSPPTTAVREDASDAVATFMRMTLNNRLPADISEDETCARLFGTAETVSQRLGLYTTAAYTHSDATESEAAICELNPESAASEVSAFVGVWPYDPDDWKAEKGECGTSASSATNLTFECRADAWNLVGWIVNPGLSASTGTYIDGSLDDLVSSAFEWVRDELAKYPAEFYVSPYSTVAPLDSDGSDNPTGSWGPAEPCEEGNPPFYGHLGQCVVPGIGPRRVLEECRGAAVADLWRRSAGKFGRALPDKSVASMVETCVAGTGLAVTAEANVKGYPGDSSTGLRYILVTGGLTWDGETTATRVLWDAVTGNAIDDHARLEQVEGWAG